MPLNIIYVLLENNINVCSEIDNLENLKITSNKTECPVLPYCWKLLKNNVKEKIMPGFTIPLKYVLLENNIEVYAEKDSAYQKKCVQNVKSTAYYALHYGLWLCTALIMNGSRALVLKNVNKTLYKIPGFK